MDAHRELLWQRGRATWTTVRSSQKRFWENAKIDLPAAYVELASDYYTLVKRYMSWWLLPVAILLLWRAAWNVNVAYNILSDITKFRSNQIDVMTTIWLRTPRVLGGNKTRAKLALEFALGPQNPEASTMKAHTRALMFITLGQIDTDQWKVASYYKVAHNLIDLIKNEDSPDRDYQLIRVRAAVGFFYFDHGLWAQAHRLLRLAHERACQIANDQRLKIEAGCRKRGITLYEKAV